MASVCGVGECMGEDVGLDGFGFGKDSTTTSIGTEASETLSSIIIKSTFGIELTCFTSYICFLSSSL